MIVLIILHFVMVLVDIVNWKNEGGFFFEKKRIIVQK